MIENTIQSFIDFNCMHNPIEKLYSQDGNQMCDEATIITMIINQLHLNNIDGIKHTQIAKFMEPTWGPPGSCRPQMGPILAHWTLLSGNITHQMCHVCTITLSSMQSLLHTNRNNRRIEATRGNHTYTCFHTSDTNGAFVIPSACPIHTCSVLLPMVLIARKMLLGYQAVPMQNTFGYCR